MHGYGWSVTIFKRKINPQKTIAAQRILREQEEVQADQERLEEELAKLEHIVSSGRMEEQTLENYLGMEELTREMNFYDKIGKYALGAIPLMVNQYEPVEHQKREDCYKDWMTNYTIPK